MAESLDQNQQQNQQAQGNVSFFLFFKYFLKLVTAKLDKWSTETNFSTMQLLIFRLKLTSKCRNFFS